MTRIKRYNGKQEVATKKPETEIVSGFCILMRFLPSQE